MVSLAPRFIQARPLKTSMGGVQACQADGPEDARPYLKFRHRVNASNLLRLSDYSRFEPLIGTPGDGASPSCAIVDEFHEHDKPDLYDTMQTGMGAREQPLMFVITTAGRTWLAHASRSESRRRRCSKGL